MCYCPIKCVKKIWKTVIVQQRLCQINWIILWYKPILHCEKIIFAKNNKYVFTKTKFKYTPDIKTMNFYSKEKSTMYKRIHKTFSPYMEISTKKTSYLIYESGNRKAASTHSDRNSMQISHRHHSHANGKDISVKRWQRSGCWVEKSESSFSRYERIDWLSAGADWAKKSSKTPPFTELTSFTMADDYIIFIMYTFITG